MIAYYYDIIIILIIDNNTKMAYSCPLISICSCYFSFCFCSLCVTIYYHCHYHYYCIYVHGCRTTDMFMVYVNVFLPHANEISYIFLITIIMIDDNNNISLCILFYYIFTYVPLLLSLHE